MTEATRFIPFPALVTERLLLRQIKDGDAEALFSFRGDAENRKFIDMPLARTLGDIRKFMKKVSDGIACGEWILWGICLKNDERLIGTICLWQFSDDQSVAEVGYELSFDSQGFGYMQEALRCVVKYGFGVLSLDEIQAYTNAFNIPSRILLEKCAFVLKKIKNIDHSSKDEQVQGALYGLQNPEGVK